jgi:succinoglycan biosynthesis transport protein ExoP
MIEEENNAKSLQDYIGIFKRRKFSLLVPSAITFFLAAILAFGLPATYESQATILIEEQEIPQDFVRTTITTFADQQVQVISQRVLTVKNIADIVNKFNLYEQDDPHSRMPRTELAALFRENMSMELVSADVIDPRSGRPTQATIAFKLAFRDEARATAQKVTNELVTLFLNENLRKRNEQAASTEVFLTAEAERLNNELLNLEQLLANFKTTNEGSLPSQYQFNLSIIERTRRDISNVNLRIQELTKHKLELAAQLTQLSPSVPVVLPSGEVVLSETDRLKALESTFQRMSALYLNNHPDVIRVTREIDDLKSSIAAAGKSTNTHTAETQQADNPAYVLLNTQHSSTAYEIQSLSTKRIELQAKISQYEILIKRAPNVEKNYQPLLRDYSNTTVKYQDIRSKQREAAVSKNLEQKQKGERFILIEPPALPIDPVSPNRTAILLLGLVLAAGAGVGFALFKEAIDVAVHGVRELTAIMGAPPLVSIPYITNVYDIKKSKRGWQIYVTLAVAVGIGLAIYLHFFFKPLDVLYFVILNNLGLR